MIMRAIVKKETVIPTTMISLSGISITGNDAGNYTLAATTAATSNNAVITPKTLTVAAADNAAKEYNGLTPATTTTDTANTPANAKLSDNRVAGDAVTVNNTGAAFDEKNVSTTRIITVSGISDRKSVV